MQGNLFGQNIKAHQVEPFQVAINSNESSWCGDLRFNEKEHPLRLVIGRRKVFLINHPENLLTLVQVFFQRIEFLSCMENVPNFSTFEMEKSFFIL